MISSVLIAGTIAVALSFIELRSRLRTRLTKAAVGWLVARFGLDVAGGVVAVALLPLVAPGEWTSGPAGGFVAGVAAPALLRLRLLSLKVGDQEVPIGVATAFEPIRNFIERQIDEIGATEQSHWLNRVVLPTLQPPTWTPDKVAAEARAYVGSLSFLAEAPRLAALAYLDDVLADSTSDLDKNRLIIQKVLDLQGHRLIDRMLDQ